MLFRKPARRHGHYTKMKSRSKQRGSAMFLFYYHGGLHGLTATHADKVKADVPDFL